MNRRVSHRIGEYPAGVVGVEGRLARIKERIAHAAERVGRDPGLVLLIGATKDVDAGRLRDALALGLRDFGENRIQEALPKIAAVGEGPRWHFIGHLQRNKAKPAVEHFGMIHSLDSPALARAVDRAAGAAGRRVEVLVEVNVGAETTKYGAAPAEVDALVLELGECRHLVPIGLMTVAPEARDPEVVRPFFRSLRVLRDRLRSGSVGEDFRELSMGMSGDFEVAVEEGATMVRIGRAIFGERT
ncbi:MAG: YggS family pyridoxal phosphate-dependent enzyme [Candidatus Methylomirabilaceae bacterium]